MPAAGPGEVPPLSYPGRFLHTSGIFNRYCIGHTLGRSVYKQHMHTFRWGIIGPGSIARDFANDLKLVNGQQHEVHAILGHSKEKTEEFAGEFSVPAIFYDIASFLHNPGFDAVYIATPHTLHYEQTGACLNAGIPVLCEKPITINIEQLESLVRLAREKNTLLVEGMWIRFLPSIRQVLDIVGSGQIGKVIAVRANMSYKAPKDDSNRYFNPELGGGSLLDLGVYPVFLANLLLGKPPVVKAAGKLSDKGIDETCAALLGYPAGQYALIESSIITQTDRTAEIYGDKGVIRILAPWNEKPAGIEVCIYNAATTHVPCNWEGRGFQFEVEEVANCIKNGRISSPLMAHQLSLDIMRTMDEIKDQLHVKYESYE